MEGLMEGILDFEVEIVVGLKVGDLEVVFVGDNDGEETFDGVIDGEDTFDGVTDGRVVGLVGFVGVIDDEVDFKGAADGLAPLA